MKAAIFKLTVLMVGVLMSGCFDDPGTDIVVGSAAYLELDRAGQPNPLTSLTYTQNVDGNDIRYNVQVNIMGKPQPNAVTVQYSIDPTSTAQDGVHYSIVGTAGSITIPAGESIGTIDIDIIDDSWNPLGSGGRKDLIISLTGGDLPLSKYIKATYRITIN